MTCYRPQVGYLGANGQFVLARKDSPTGAPMSVPCGRCAGCQMARASAWAIRISHEAKFHKDSIFITLTFSDEHLPDNYSVDKRDIQLFIKRVRKHLDTEFDKQHKDYLSGLTAAVPQRTKIRYFAVGEYGSETLRPHYHAILFGWLPDDAVVWRRTGQGHHVYRSATLERLWPFGNVEFGSVTPESGGYVARYSLKKVGGAQSGDYYTRLNPVTGEVVQVQPEFALMSNRPGIGREWFDRYERDVFPCDFVVVDGVKRPVPIYYKRRLKDRFELKGSSEAGLVKRDDATVIQRKRRMSVLERADDCTPERLAEREESALLRQKKLKREL